MRKKVFLRLSREGYYYAGREHWVRDPKRALDLETVESATELARGLDLESMQIVVSFGDGSHDWYLQLRRRQGVGVPAAPATVQALLRRAA